MDPDSVTIKKQRINSTLKNCHGNVWQNTQPSTSGESTHKKYVCNDEPENSNSHDNKGTKTKDKFCISFQQILDKTAAERRSHPALEDDNAEEDNKRDMDEEDSRFSLDKCQEDKEDEEEKRQLEYEEQNPPKKLKVLLQTAAVDGKDEDKGKGRRHKVREVERK